MTDGFAAGEGSRPVADSDEWFRQRRRRPVGRRHVDTVGRDSTETFATGGEFFHERTADGIIPAGVPIAAGMR